MAAACRSCEADVRWTVTAHGRRMPVNAAPSDDGNIILVDMGPDLPPVARVFADADTAARTAVAERLDPDARYVSHFATCSPSERVAAT